MNQADCDDTVVPARMMVEQQGASETTELEASVSMKTQVKDNSDRGTDTLVGPSPESVARPSCSKEQASSSVEQQPSSLFVASASSSTASRVEQNPKAYWIPEERETPKPRNDTNEQAWAGRSDRKRNIHALSADPTSGMRKRGLRELLLHPQLILDTNGQWTTVAALAALAKRQARKGIYA